MMPRLRGRVAFIFAEPNFDVDRILGFETMRSHDLATMQSNAMREFDAGFVRDVRPGDLLVGGTNFGYGHPHGPPMAVMRALGVSGVIAESFAPLYLMGELAAGFPQIACTGVSCAVSRWDELEVDWEGGCVRNQTSGRVLAFKPITPHSQALLEAGGLFALLRPAPVGEAGRGA